MDDLISRQAAIEAILAIKDYGNSDRANALGLAECAITTLPSAQPETHDKRTETHACDCISRQAAISAICNACGKIDCDKMDKCKKLQLPPANCSEFPNNSDTISRQAAIDALRYAQHRFTVADEAGGIGTVKWSEDVIYFAAAERILTELPSAQPEPCEDAVSRNAIIQKLNTMDRYVSEELVLCDTDKRFPKNEVFIVDDVYEEIVENLPSAQPDTDEWCTDCKEYDHERQCCPRWSRVIRETLKDAQPEIVRCKDCKYGEQDEAGRWFCISLGCQIGNEDGSGYCADAERRTDEA